MLLGDRRRARDTLQHRNLLWNVTRRPSFRLGHISNVLRLHSTGVWRCLLKLINLLGADSELCRLVLVARTITLPMSTVPIGKFRLEFHIPLLGLLLLLLEILHVQNLLWYFIGLVLKNSFRLWFIAFLLFRFPFLHNLYKFLSYVCPLYLLLIVCMYVEVIEDKSSSSRILEDNFKVLGLGLGLESRVLSLGLVTQVLGKTPRHTLH